MKKYYLKSWGVTITTILLLSAIDGYLYFGVQHAFDYTKIVIIVLWLIAVITNLAVTIVCNVIRKKRYKDM